MNTIDESEDYQVGYRKPPKSGQFKEGASGNPSGRPKRLSDFDSELMRELNAPIVINENGKRKVIKKSEASAKQLVNKAVSGNFREQRLLASLRRDMMAKATEQALQSQNQRNIDSLPMDDLTDEELWVLMGRTLPEHLHYAITKLISEDSLHRPVLGPGEVKSKELCDQWTAKRPDTDR